MSPRHEYRLGPNGKLQYLVGPIRALYGPGNRAAAWYPVTNAMLAAHRPSNANINGNTGYKALPNRNGYYYKVKKHANFNIWEPHNANKNLYVKNERGIRKATPAEYNVYYFGRSNKNTTRR